MTTRRTFAAVALGVFATAAAAGEVDKRQRAGAPAPAFAETRWLAPDVDLVAFLTLTPGECLRRPEDENTQFWVEVGRAAFKSPFLFGGFAARGGLSCDSCHRDGGDNPGFFAAGLSDDPGTADVTSSLFSKVREDDVFNPVLIPSLTDVADRDSFGATAPRATLRGFIESAVADEFQGAPPAGVVDGLTAYVAHLDGAYCPDAPSPLTAARATDDAARAIDAAVDALDRNAESIADFLILSAQYTLGKIHDRYADPDLSKQRVLLTDASSSLAAARSALKSDPAAARSRLTAIKARLFAARGQLREGEEKSLYDEDVLRRSLPFADASSAPESAQ